MGNATMHVKRKVTVDKNIHFKENSLKPPKNKPSVSNAKFATS
jgi:hypothetical protein